LVVAGNGNTVFIILGLELPIFKILTVILLGLLN
jgi:hypothetical protein